MESHKIVFNGDNSIDLVVELPKDYETTFSFYPRTKDMLRLQVWNKDHMLFSQYWTFDKSSIVADDIKKIKQSFKGIEVVSGFRFSIMEIFKEHHKYIIKKLYGH